MMYKPVFGFRVKVNGNEESEELHAVIKSLTSNHSSIFPVFSKQMAGYIFTLIFQKQQWTMTAKQGEIIL